MNPDGNQIPPANPPRSNGHRSSSLIKYGLLALMLGLIAVMAVANLWRGGVLDSQSPPQITPERILQSYQTGVTYESLLVFDLRGKGVNHDWGITVNTNFIYHGEVESAHKIEANDGRELTFVQHFTRAQNLCVATDVDNIDLHDLGRPGELVLAAADWAGTAGLDLPRGWTELSRRQAEAILDLPATRTFLSNLASGELRKAMGYVDSLQDKTVRITYVDGFPVKDRVTRLEPIGCTLTRDEEGFLRSMCAVSDAHIVPYDECNQGDQWFVAGHDLPPMTDPSMHAVLGGAVLATCRENNANEAIIALDDRSSHLTLLGYDKSAKYLGDWYPKGELTFSHADNIVRLAKLNGDFTVQRESTNHWIFKAEFVMKPIYDVVYTCKALPK